MDEPLAVRTCVAVGKEPVEASIRNEAPTWAADLRTQRDVRYLRAIRNLAHKSAWADAYLVIAEVACATMERLGGSSPGDRTSLGQALIGVGRRQEGVALIEQNLEHVKDDPVALGLQFRNLAGAYIYLATTTAYTQPVDELLGRMRALERRVPAAARRELQERIFETSAATDFIRALHMKQPAERERRIGAGEPVDPARDPVELLWRAAKTQTELLQLMRSNPRRRPQAEAVVLKNLASVQEHCKDPQAGVTYLEAAVVLAKLYGAQHAHALHAFESALLLLVANGRIDEVSSRWRTEGCLPISDRFSCGPKNEPPQETCESS